MEYFRKEWLFTVRDFPIFINSDIPLKNTLWHTQDFFELVLVARGHGEHRLSETVSYGIMQGDVFAISAGKVHCYTNTHDMLLYNILFEPEFLGSKWKELLEMPIIRSLENSPLHKFHLPMFTRSAAEVLLRRIIGELSMQPPSFRISVKALFLEFLVLLGRAQVKELHSSDYRQEAIHRAIIHMERNLARKLTLADISKHANLNKNYFCECFRNETGTSPWDYLIQLRVEKVKKLLSETDLPISEIAQMSGFCDQSYMSRAFRKTECMTPRSFRAAFRRISTGPAAIPPE